jgi:argonaute-like protein implicated in RNA metabolism and viral defense
MFSEDPRLNKEIKEDMEDILDAIDYHTEILDEHFIEIGIVYQILKRLDETS